jgi:ribosome modulation factor
MQTDRKKEDRVESVQ